MILICTARVSPRCIKTDVKHGHGAATKERVCPFCSAAMNMNPKLREKYNASVLKGTGNGETSKPERVRQ